MRSEQDSDRDRNDRPSKVFIAFEVLSAMHISPTRFEDRTLVMSSFASNGLMTAWTVRIDKIQFTGQWRLFNTMVAVKSRVTRKHKFHQSTQSHQPLVQQDRHKEAVKKVDPARPGYPHIPRCITPMRPKSSNRRKVLWERVVGIRRSVALKSLRDKHCRCFAI